MGLRATDKCADVFPACPVSVAPDGTPSTTTTKRIPIILTVDHYGTTAAYDVMITHPTGRTAAAHKPLHTAAKGERGKQAGYDAHKARCRALGSTDPGLDVPLVPLLFETYGAAGKNMQDFLRGMVRSYSTQILSLEDESATAYFRTYWSYRLSVAVACGTAAIVHHVPRGESVPARFRRPIKADQYRI